MDQHMFQISGWMTWEEAGSEEQETPGSAGGLVKRRKLDVPHFFCTYNNCEAYMMLRGGYFFFYAICILHKEHEGWRRALLFIPFVLLWCGFHMINKSCLIPLLSELLGPPRL